MCPTPAPGTGTISNPDNTTTTTLRTAFHLLDADGDGKISYEDLRAFYAGDEDAAVIRSMMSVADFNHDGFVDYDEFQKQLLLSTPTPTPAMLMEDAFRVMDRDGDGKVGHQDLKAYLSMAGVEADDDDVGAMITLAAAGDPDGAVTLHALLNVLAVL